MVDPDEAEVLTYLERLSNWGRWGDEDELGTLNFITEEKRRQAAECVRVGRTVSCARTIPTNQNGDDGIVHFMMTTGESARPDAWGGATDWFGMPVHGHGTTHLDAVGHAFWDRRMYNGVPASKIRVAGRMRQANISAARGGIVSRGVLLDIPRAQGRDRVEPGTAISADDLEAACRHEGVTVGEGDILVVRTGRDAGGPEAGDGHGTHGEIAAAGLGASTLPWLHERRVALLVGDRSSEVKPPQYERVVVPIHIVGMVAMGLYLLDNAYLEDLSEACASLGTWDFLFTVAPLVLDRATGSPVNPIAVL